MQRVVGEGECIWMHVHLVDEAEVRELPCRASQVDCHCDLANTAGTRRPPRAQGQRQCRISSPFSCKFTRTFNRLVQGKMTHVSGLLLTCAPALYPLLKLAYQVYADNIRSCAWRTLCEETRIYGLVDNSHPTSGVTLS